MKKFKAFLTEGGNAPYIDRKTGDILGDADRVNFKNVDRSRLRKVMLKMFKELNARFKKTHGKALWPDFSNVENGRVFNGSSEHFFNPDITDKEFTAIKKLMGDIDVAIPKEILPDLFNLLASIENEEIVDGVIYKGQNKKEVRGYQINSVFHVKSIDLNIQVDFEAVQYEKGMPDEFGKFSHNSSWRDMKSKLKGFGHKYLLIALTRNLSKFDGLIVTPSSTPDDIKISEAKKFEHPSMFSFSVDRGFRKKFEPFMDNGKHLAKEGKKLYRELSTDDSTYSTDVSELFELIFEVKPTRNDKENFKSFLGLLDLMKKFRIDPKPIFDSFQKMLWGESSQMLYKNLPDKDQDVKTVFVDEFVKKFPQVVVLKDKSLVDDFYSN